MTARMQRIHIIILSAVLLLSVLGILYGTTRGDNPRGYALRTVSLTTEQDTAAIKTFPEPPEQAVPTAFIAEYPEGISTQNAQALYLAFLSAEDPPDAAHFSGDVEVNGKDAGKGVYIWAVLPDGMPDQTDFTCGSYEIRSGHEGELGAAGYLHCVCGGGMYPDCTAQDLAFEGSLTKDGPRFPLAVSGDNLWEKDTFKTIGLQGTFSTPFSGTLLINGEPAPAGTVLQIGSGSWGCGSTTLTTPGTFTDVDCLCDTEGCQDGGIHFSVKEPDWDEWVYPDPEESVVWDGEPKQITLNAIHMTNTYEGTILADGMTIPLGSRISVETITMDQRCTSFTTTKTDPTAYSITCKCLGAPCQDQDPLTFRVEPDYGAGNSVSVPATAEGDATWTSQDGVFKTIDLNLDGVMTRYAGNVQIEGTVGEEGSSISAFVGYSRCGSGFVDNSGQYSLSCWCDPTTQSCTGETVNFKLQPFETEGLLGPIWPMTATGVTTWDTVPKQVDLSADNMRTRLYGSVIIDDLPAPDGTPIQVKPSYGSYDDDSAWWTCGSTYTVNNGTYNLSCWCNDEYESYPYCTLGQPLKVRVGTYDNYYPYVYSQDDLTWDGTVKQVDIGAYSTPRCVDGSHLDSCTIDKPDYCSALNDTLGEIVPNCSVCGCPHAVRGEYPDKWINYECCGNGECVLETLGCLNLKEGIGVGDTLGGGVDI